VKRFLGSLLVRFGTFGRDYLNADYLVATGLELAFSIVWLVGLCMMGTAVLAVAVKMVVG
jgi:hypothetical protein